MSDQNVSRDRGLKPSQTRRKLHHEAVVAASVEAGDARHTTITKAADAAKKGA